MKLTPVASHRKTRKGIPPATRERNREATMQRLKEIGLEVFSDFGFDGATTRLISQRSGVNESLIIRYFESKSGLLLAIILDYIRRTKEAVRHYTPGETVEQEIGNYLCFRFEQAIASRDFMLISFSKLATDPKIRAEVDRFCSSSFAGGNSELEERLTRFQAKGSIRKDVGIKDIVRMIMIHELGGKFSIMMVSSLESKTALLELRYFAKLVSSAIV